MMKFQIPGWEDLVLEHLVLDFNGTIGLDGQLIPGVKERLYELAKQVKVHIITADTFGTCKAQCQSLNCTLHILDSSMLGGPLKERYVERLGPSSVAAVGNGSNDVAMLEKAALGIAVIGDEGLCINALNSADLVVSNICNALDLLLQPKRLVATLRR